jgi:hypothetical protein
MQTITVILSEGGAPWPLIYTVQVADPTDFAEVTAAAIEARLCDLGDEFRAEVENGLELHLAFAGDLTPLGDWRE